MTRKPQHDQVTGLSMEKDKELGCGEWLPIESAPRDGTEILLMLLFPDSERINVVHNCRWVEDYDGNEFWMGWEDDGNKTTCSEFDPQYWMPCSPFKRPLPDVPKEGG